METTKTKTNGITWVSILSIVILFVMYLGVWVYRDVQGLKDIKIDLVYLIPVTIYFFILTMLKCFDCEKQKKIDLPTIFLVLITIGCFAALYN